MAGLVLNSGIPAIIVEQDAAEAYRILSLRPLARAPRAFYVRSGIQNPQRKRDDNNERDRRPG